MRWAVCGQSRRHVVTQPQFSTALDAGLLRRASGAQTGNQSSGRGTPMARTMVIRRATENKGNQASYLRVYWWALRGSNPRPSPCKGADRSAGHSVGRQSGCTPEYLSVPRSAPALLRRVLRKRLERMLASGQSCRWARAIVNRCSELHGVAFLTRDRRCLVSEIVHRLAQVLLDMLVRAPRPIAARSRPPMW